MRGTFVSCSLIRTPTSWSGGWWLDISTSSHVLLPWRSVVIVIVVTVVRVVVIIAVVLR